MPCSGGESRFPFVPFTNADEVVGTAKVQLGEIFSSSEFVRLQERVVEGNGLAGDIIERPVVNTGTKDLRLSS